MNNNSTNSSDVGDDELMRQIPMLIAILATTMFTALLGNLFLAFIIIKKSGRRRLSPVQILILHTCAADVFFALWTILPQLAQFITFPTFYGGDFLCKLVKYLQVVPMYASPYLLMAIGFDRFIAVCKPLKAYRWKYRLVHWLVILAWGISFAFATPQLAVFEYGTVESVVWACTSTMTAEQEKISILFFSAFAWVVPSVVVAVLYTFVCVEVWRSGNNVTSPMVESRRRPTMSNGNNNGNCSNGYSKSGRRSKRNDEKSHRRKSRRESSVNGSLRKIHNSSLSANKIKTVKLTISIVACNFLLLAPFCLVNVISVVFPTSIDDLTSTCIMLIGNANSCVNPWIYLVFNYKQVYNLLFKKVPQVSRFRHYQSTMSCRVTLHDSALIGSRKNTLARLSSSQRSIKREEESP